MSNLVRSSTVTPRSDGQLPVYSVPNQTRVGGPSGRPVTLQVLSRASSFVENHPPMAQVGILYYIHYQPTVTILS